MQLARASGSSQPMGRTGSERRQEIARHTATQLDHMRHERLLPDEMTLNKIMRYEAHLNRQLYQALHELEALQTRRPSGVMLLGPPGRAGAARRIRPNSLGFVPPSIGSDTGVRDDVPSSGMLPTAHVASALVFNRLTGLDRGWAPAVLGALAPDAIDKTLAWVFGVVPSGRHIGHTPFMAGLLALGTAVALDQSRGRAFGAAYLVHLVGDLWHLGHVPWLMPFRAYDKQSQRWRVDLSSEALLLETIGAAAIVLLSRRPPHEGRLRPKT